MIHPVAAAIGRMIREQPRPALDWCPLSEAEYSRLIGEVAYSVGTLTERDVAELVEEHEQAASAATDVS